MLVHPHGKMLFANNMPNFTGQNNLLCGLFKTEIKTDELLTLLFAAFLLVNRFTEGLRLQQYGLHWIAVVESRSGL